MTSGRRRVTFLVRVCVLLCLLPPGSDVAGAVPEPRERSTLPFEGPLPEVIRKVAPVYPPAARAQGITGTVLVQALVGKDGKVVETRVVKSVALLDSAAVEAVRRYEFVPAVVNGEAVAVWIALPVRFSLDGYSAPVGALPPSDAITSTRSTCLGLHELFSRHGFELVSGRHQAPAGRGEPVCEMTFTVRGTDAGESVRGELARDGWSEVLERSADGPDGTSFVMRRDSVEIEVAGSWTGGVETPGPAVSRWDVAVRTVAATPDARAVPIDRFNTRLAAAGDSAWAQAPATIAIEFVGGAACACAEFRVESTSRPEGFDAAEVTVTRDGYTDDSVRGDRHHIVMRREAGIWNITSATIAWRCQEERGHQGYSADPCQ